MFYSYVNNELISADDYLRDKLYRCDKPIYDMFTNSELVVFKRKSIDGRRAHFAFKSIPDQYKKATQNGESNRHLELKELVFNWAKNQGFQPIKEKWQYGRTPDVMFENFCCEIQCSYISLKDLDARCKFYYDNNLKHFWYFDYSITSDLKDIISTYLGNLIYLRKDRLICNDVIKQISSDYHEVKVIKSNGNVYLIGYIKGQRRPKVIRKLPNNIKGNEVINQLEKEVSKRVSGVNLFNFK